jgi:hypothetical protein
MLMVNFPFQLLVRTGDYISSSYSIHLRFAVFLFLISTLFLHKYQFFFRTPLPLAFLVYDVRVSVAGVKRTKGQRSKEINPATGWERQ